MWYDRKLNDFYKKKKNVMFWIMILSLPFKTAVFSIWVYFPRCYWFVLNFKPFLYPWLDALGNKWHQDCEVCQPRLGIRSRNNEPNHSQQPADWNPVRGHEAGAGGSRKESAQYGEEKGTSFPYKSVTCQPKHIPIGYINYWMLNKTHSTIGCINGVYYY